MVHGAKCSMDEVSTRVVHLEEKSRMSEEALKQLRAYITLVKTNAGCTINDVEKFAGEANALEKDNNTLKAQLAQLKQHLASQERVGTTPPSQSTVHNSCSKLVQVAAQEAKKAIKKSRPVQRECPHSSASAKVPVDVARLDFRVGKVVRACRHPDADTLYIEEVDVGESKLRTVCSSLVHTVPLEQVQDRMAMFLCNLKPVKMCGVLSEAMIMCACVSDEEEEILDPPPGCQPGDRVYCEGYKGTPDTVLNPKKKVFETVQPDLRTNKEGVACYKDIPFSVEGRDGVFRAATLKGTSIK